MLRAKTEDALRSARKQYLSALRAADWASLPAAEEELKQCTAARQVIVYTIGRHQEKDAAERL